MHPLVYNLGLLPADRIVVPKSGLRIVQHHAVYLGKNQLGQDLIAENKIGYGVRLVTADEFFQDVLEVTSIERFSGNNHERKVVIQNALNRLNAPYDLINYNCQHFANEVLKGKAESEQVNNVVNALKIAATLFLFVAVVETFSNKLIR